MSSDKSVRETKSDVLERHERAEAEYLEWTPRLFIGGEWVEGTSGSTFETSNPTTGRTIATVPEAGEADVDEAVDAARRAYEETWSEYSATERRNILNEIADRIEDATERLATIETLNNGMPIGDAHWDMERTAEQYRYFAGMTQANHGTTIPSEGTKTVMTVREPHGVVGAIIPWNYPIAQASWKLAPALAAGNTVVLKPAEQTPISILAFLEEIEDLLPDGVVNVVTGRGEPTGAALTSSPDIDKLAFTGSTAVGKTVMKSAAENVTDISLELGGNSPIVVFPDADPQRAAEIAAGAIFTSTGENCCAGSRLFVHEAIETDVLEALSEVATEYRPGDPLLESTAIGPKVSAAQRDRTLEFIAAATGDDANVVTGGSVPDDESLGDGQFVLPTVINEIDHDHRAVQEEIFGPVLRAFSWSDYDEMIELANDVDHGLAAGVIASDITDAQTAAKDIEAGTVWVNQYNDFPQGMPFGGYKQSGIGRERALETLTAYTQTKTINISDEPV
ncbi:aldehyde dehydrogenase family protein [Natrarchaeobius halalkaliphilus]|uniref:Aldehyde dehydrogenase family protein n=1 Tax=Natrarchaeobius halalkaliphilus TaxID=1679091 RepID=A0A3N6LPJ2_9EURY|nr:aldehyde dehydrogenase family protein [Natrarchaeobius halalkaliphilus]RQG90067.1 aldehyde dehydrogenase family protein [Natrarchaeobius halalkaliphilus]